MRPDDIVAYTYRAGIYSPETILAAYKAGREGGGAWCVYPANGAPEAVLDECASCRGIDRYNEVSFDSDDFPKVIFRDQWTDELRDNYPEVDA